jgi:hypothetical protein
VKSLQRMTLEPLTLKKPLRQTLKPHNSDFLLTLAVAASVTQPFQC